ncbi:MAG TPA: Gfo/Idh/MocA family oxidoreductase [Thermomicrobiales bacterium]|nr:Gfo/Idh/MocA family oxidoreductase [Thermomicrobiales bacterium]
MEPNASSIDRRSFLKAASAAGVGLWASGGLSPAYGYRGSPNERLRVAVMGVNGRGEVLAKSFATAQDSEVVYIVDVDTQVLAKVVGAVEELQEKKPEGVVDYRRTLDDRNVDALVIAAPDHWHALATINGLKAGKHVYVEKPAAHNPAEGELMVAAQRKYDRLVQMGNQQRSDPRSIEIVQQIREGLIGRPYYARTWYANARPSIGIGKPAAVPAHLDWELWQGPAPRVPFHDNYVHYNWHWFWNWGTGEVANNGTHEIDLARWALGVDYPVRVTSVGGRYHYQDDWQFYDTQDVGYDFADGKTIVWQGRSSNGFPVLNRGRGTSIHGTEGTVVLDRDGYLVYDLKNNLVQDVSGQEKIDALDTRGGDVMTDRHIENFINAVRVSERLNAPIHEGHVSSLLTHLGNIAQRTGDALRIDPKSGHIIGNAEAQKLWGREYAPGWAPVV